MNKIRTIHIDFIKNKMIRRLYNIVIIIILLTVLLTAIQHLGIFQFMNISLKVLERNIIPIIGVILVLVVTIKYFGKGKVRDSKLNKILLMNLEK